MFDYKESRLRNINSPLGVVYEYYIDKGGHPYPPPQFAAYLQSWLTKDVTPSNITYGIDMEHMHRVQQTFNANFQFLIQKLDVEHNTIFVENLTKNQLIKII